MKKIAIIILTISLITSCASKKASCEAYGNIENTQKTKNNL
jgi:hypothetical protein